MFFTLVNGVAHFATHKKDGEYYFESDIIPEDAEEVEQPSQQILNRAEKLKGKTYSRSEFEKLLFSITEEERIEALEQAMLEIVLGGDT